MLARQWSQGGPKRENNRVIFHQANVPKTVRTIPRSRYLALAHIFHWAYAEHYQLLLTGSKERPHKRTRVMLPRLVREGRLREKRLGKKKVYCARNRRDDNIVHGLGCTECLVRTYLAKPEGEIVAERYFRGFGSRPEWGIRYPSGSMLLLEFSTADNFSRPVMKTKVVKYNRHLSDIAAFFNARPFVVFVVDAPRAQVERFVEKTPEAGENFYFTDYETFLSVPPGKQLVAPIYLWGQDHRYYPLADGEVERDA